MRAVWSFWTKPFRAFHADRWTSEKHHLLSWILSFETARQHYPDTALYTDDDGARLLTDTLRLPFASVTTELNVLSDLDAAWWALGKLYTYRAQTTPFVHIDSDVFLWNALPLKTVSAPVFAQNPERFEIGNSYYRPQLWEHLIAAVGGWLPAEWTWYSRRGGHEAVCCGILGGRRTDFLAYYADGAIRTILHPRNQSAWRLLADRIGDNILFEQYFLSACLQYHTNRSSSPYCEVRADYLFESDAAAFDPQLARQAGYTHLIAGAKRDPDLAVRLEARVQRDYPEQYEQLIRRLHRA